MKNYLSGRWWPILALVLFAVASSVAYFNRKVDVEFLDYGFFSIAFGALLIRSLSGRISKLLLVLNVFLFLGFWGKFTTFLMMGDKFPEINIVKDANLFNSALIYAGWFACANLLIQEILRKNLGRLKPMKLPLVRITSIQTVAVVLVLIALIGLNSYFGILRVGLPAETHVRFPFSLLFSWFMGPGTAFTFFYFVPQLSVLPALAVIVLMISLSASTLSRNAMMYFVFPLLFSFFLKKRDFKKNVTIWVSASLFFLSIIIGVSQFRMHFYYKEKTQAESLEAQPPLLQVRDVLINRWVGIEGALVALNHVSDQTFINLFVEKPSGGQSLYQEMARTGWDNHQKFLFFTVPGPVGFILFAESPGLRLLALVGFFILLAIAYFVCEGLLPEGLAQSSVSWWAGQFLAQISLFFAYNAIIFIAYLAIPLAIIIIGARSIRVFSRGSEA